MELELLFLLISCYISLIQCDNFAPGVPPRQEDTIKFHEPTDFQQPQQQQPEQPHGHAQGQGHGHKQKHRHGAKINFDADNAEHAREYVNFKENLTEFSTAIKFHEPNEFKVASNIRDTLNGFKQENNQPQKHWERGRGKHHHGAKINFDQQNAEKAREHMKHHNREEYVDVDKLSQPQLIMQHFRNFDLDKNGYIDGLEILKAAIRMNEEHHDEDYDDSSDIDEMAEEADETLAQYDENNDGKIHYGEFYRKHKKILDDGGSAEPNTFTQNAELNND